MATAVNANAMEPSVDNTTTEGQPPRRQTYNNRRHRDLDTKRLDDERKTKDMMDRLAELRQKKKERLAAAAATSKSKRTMDSDPEGGEDTDEEGGRRKRQGIGSPMKGVAAAGRREGDAPAPVGTPDDDSLLEVASLGLPGVDPPTGGDKTPAPPSILRRSMRKKTPVLKPPTPKAPQSTASARSKQATPKSNTQVSKERKSRGKGSVKKNTRRSTSQTASVGSKPKNANTTAPAEKDKAKEGPKPKSPAPNEAVGEGEHKRKRVGWGTALETGEKKTRPPFKHTTWVELVNHIPPHTARPSQGWVKNFDTAMELVHRMDESICLVQPVARVFNDLSMKTDPKVVMEGRTCRK